MAPFVVRPAAARGVSRNDWLDSRHSFSFDSYHDPQHEGFRSLRVVNEDIVQPDNGFAMHGHRNMEIVTYVVAGALSHKDNLGHHGVIRPGEIQRMSAGSGILHSEFNASATEPVHLLQIWITPATRNDAPDYAQKSIVAAEVEGRFGLLASSDGKNGSLRLRQDANLWLARLDAGKSASFALEAGRGG